MDTWYYSHDGTTFNQCENRDHAIACLDGRRGFVGLGHTPEIRLSTYLIAEDILEDLEDSLYDLSGDDPLFDCTKEQKENLSAHLRAAAEKWQQSNNLTFTQWAIVWTDGPHEIPAKSDDEKRNENGANT